MKARACERPLNRLACTHAHGRTSSPARLSDGASDTTPCLTRGTPRCATRPASLTNSGVSISMTTWIFLLSPAIASALDARPTDIRPPTARSGHFTRRAALLSPLAVAANHRLQAASAAGFATVYKDERYGVSFGLPDGFVATPQELADGRRLVTAADPKDDDTNVFIAFTPIRPDYSSLGSFGTIDFVGNTLLPQCGDLSYGCSFQRGDMIDGKMLAKETFKGNYVYDYTIEQKGGPKRHLRSIFAIKADAGASVLVTLTAQCLEARHADLAPTFKAVIESYVG